MAKTPPLATCMTAPENMTPASNPTCPIIVKFKKETRKNVLKLQDYFCLTKVKPQTAVITIDT